MLSGALDLGALCDLLSRTLETLGELLTLRDFGVFLGESLAEALSGADALSR